jgi:hypothetical protein
MTKIHLQDAMLQLQILQGKLDASERLNKPPTKLIATREVLRQAGWMPIPKPLTDEQIGQLAEQVGLLGPKSRVGNASEATEKFARAVERAHGIGEK